MRTSRWAATLVAASLLSSLVDHPTSTLREYEVPTAGDESTRYQSRSDHTGDLHSLYSSGGDPRRDDETPEKLTLESLDHSSEVDGQFCGLSAAGQPTCRSPRLLNRNLDPNDGDSICVGSLSSNTVTQEDTEKKSGKWEKRTKVPRWVLLGGGALALAYYATKPDEQERKEWESSKEQ
jgi:hypothetical protein